MSSYRKNGKDVILIFKYLDNDLVCSYKDQFYIIVPTTDQRAELLIEADNRLYKIGEEISIEKGKKRLNYLVNNLPMVYKRR